MTRDDLILMEELNLNAWPALQTVHLDGWLLRFAGGDTRRPNSVNMFGPSTLALSHKIDAAEAVYRRWGRPCTFRMTPLVDAELADILTARGYATEGGTFVQVCEAPATTMPAGVEIFERATDDWLDGALTVRQVDGAEGDVFRAQHRAIGIAAAWALIRENGQALAVGCSTAERGWSGLTGIYVHRNARRRGLALKITQALLSWGRGHGAKQSWLQVDQSNAAAIPLYQSLGFRTAYTYHYGVLPNRDQI